VKLVLEVTGGFTGPAGKQRVEVELEQLPAAEAAQLRTELEEIPETAWGSTFSLAHPKPWDFRHVLSVTSRERDQVVTFHNGAGPPALTRIAKSLLER
jgi:hypothetical protein